MDIIILDVILVMNVKIEMIVKIFYIMWIFCDLIWLYLWGGCFEVVKFVLFVLIVLFVVINNLLVFCEILMVEGFLIMFFFILLVWLEVLGIIKINVFNMVVKIVIKDWCEFIFIFFIWILLREVY